MSQEEVLQHIQTLVNSALEDKGEDPQEVTADTELLGEGLGIDSLDLAMLVRELEQKTGHDPFKDGFIDFRTAGELAKLYVK